MKLSKLNKMLLSTTTNDQQAMMCLFEKIGDIAAGLECYEVALQNYLSMVGELLCVVKYLRFVILIIL